MFNKPQQAPHSENPWREKWVHEDHLINHRLTWLLVSQTLLFAGYATLLDAFLGADNNMSESKNRQVLLHLIQDILPLLGIAIAALVWIGVLAAFIAMFLLKRRARHDPQWKRHRLDVSGWTTVFGGVAGGLLPAVFLFAWYSVMVSIAGLR